MLTFVLVAAFLAAAAVAGLARAVRRASSASGDAARAAAWADALTSEQAAAAHEEKRRLMVECLADPGRFRDGEIARIREQAVAAKGRMNRLAGQAHGPGFRASYWRRLAKECAAAAQAAQAARDAGPHGGSARRGQRPARPRGRSMAGGVTHPPGAAPGAATDPDGRTSPANSPAIRPLRAVEAGTVAEGGGHRLDARAGQAAAARRTGRPASPRWRWRSGASSNGRPPAACLRGGVRWGSAAGGRGEAAAGSTWGGLPSAHAGPAATCRRRGLECYLGGGTPR